MEEVNPQAYKVVCGWCKVHMRGDPGAVRISHGMCPVCSERELAGLNGVCVATFEPVGWEGTGTIFSQEVSAAGEVDGYWRDVGGEAGGA